MSEPTIVVYGTSWCPDCRRAQRVLDQRGIAYTYINIEEDERAADYVVQVNNGYRSVPTIVFPDGTILVEPSNAELQRKLVG
ncbi:MAG: mycoredoxin [Chloroflexi bacterium OHK40]